MYPTADAPQAVDPIHLLALEAERHGSVGRRRLIEQLHAAERREAACERDAVAMSGACLGKAAESLSTPAIFGPGTTYTPREISLETIDDVMRYQPWNPAQRDAGAQVREVLTMAARVILRVCPAGPGETGFRAQAVRDLLNARMNANSSISFCGRF